MVNFGNSVLNAAEQADFLFYVHDACIAWQEESTTPPTDTPPPMSSDKLASTIQYIDILKIKPLHLVLARGNP